MEIEIPACITRELTNRILQFYCNKLPFGEFNQANMPSKLYPVMSVLKTINQIIAFLLELCMFFSLGYYGYQLSQNKIGRIALSIALPLIVIVLWGLFAAPKADHRLILPYRVLFELALFLITAILLYRVGRHSWAYILGITAILSELIAWIFKQ